MWCFFCFVSWALPNLRDRLCLIVCRLDERMDIPSCNVIFLEELWTRLWRNNPAPIMSSETMLAFHCTYMLPWVTSFTLLQVVLLCAVAKWDLFNRQPDKTFSTSCVQLVHYPFSTHVQTISANLLYLCDFVTFQSYSLQSLQLSNFFFYFSLNCTSCRFSLSPATPAAMLLSQIPLLHPALSALSSMVHCQEIAGP